MNQTDLQQNIQSYLASNLTSYLDLLRQMVEINSFTANPTGINDLGTLTAEAFAPLGFEAETIQSIIPEYGKHLIMTRPGKSGRKIGLISHLDTVFPPEEEIANDFFWREAGDRIYGPGTVDIKGGTVLIYMIMAALQKFIPKLYNDITWVILLDAVEERSGFDFGKLCIERLRDGGLAALTFEGGHMAGNRFKIVAARKGMAVYQARVYGKASHAGSSHPQGANAVVQMADVIQRIAALTDYERDLTFNVGAVSGGTVVNRVPHYAEADIEMRTYKNEIFDDGVASILALNGHSSVRSGDGNHPCRVEVELLRQVGPWAPNPATDHLLNIWRDTAESLGLEVEREERGGLSDGNLFWQEIPTLDGLGPSGANAHCSERSEDGSKEQEYVDVTSLVPKALLNTMAILRLANQT